MIDKSAPKPNGRPRKDPAQGLPKRLYLRSGRFYYVHANGQWENLGTDLKTASLAAELHNSGRPETGTMSYYFDRWIEEELKPRVLVKDFSVRSLADYTEAVVELKVFLGKMRPGQVTSDHIKDYLSIGLKGGRSVRVNREIAALSACFTWLLGLKIGGLKGNPCKGVKKNTEKRRERYVSDEEYQAAHATSSTIVRVFLELIYRTLQRPADIVKWTWSETVRVQNGADILYFWQGKTKKFMPIAITPELMALFNQVKNERLAEHGVTSDYLLFTQEGGPYTKDGILGMARRYIAEAKVKGATPYDLKAKGATDMCDSGVPMRTIQQLCGHKSVVTTEIYVKNRPGQAIETNSRVIELETAPREKKKRMANPEKNRSRKAIVIRKSS